MRLKSLLGWCEFETLFPRTALLWLAGISLGYSATFVVSENADAGMGTFRQAILSANTNPGLDVIEFSLPGTGIQSIAPLSPLPAITDKVVIDATTLPGAALGSIKVELRGENAGDSAGLRLIAGGNTIRGLAIGRFSREGLRIESSSNVVESCYLGTDFSGSQPRPNGLSGMTVYAGTGNRIGGSNTLEGNLLAANTQHGIYVLGSSNNVIQGNKVGLKSHTSGRLPNGMHGLVLYDAPANLVHENVISGNNGSGVYVTGAADRNAFTANVIGLDALTWFQVTNAGDGITIERAVGTRIGGTEPGEGNVISANGGSGIYLGSAGVSNTVIAGNIIGLQRVQPGPAGNRYTGVTINGGRFNIVGGEEAGARNVISANGQGGVLLTNAFGNVVAGNWIGLSLGGTNGFGNGFDGVRLMNSSSNRIGSALPLGGNVISGNAYHGVELTGTSSDNQVLGNRIGTDAAGSSAVANVLNGVRVESPRNLIGAAGAGNLLSGNGLNGLLITGSSAWSNRVQANLIGTTIGGTNALPNISAGIIVLNALGTWIGGTKPTQGNIISGNGTSSQGNGGLMLNGIGTVYTTIEGNRIGTDMTGTAALGNLQEGVILINARSNTIGGSATGSGNLIAGNGTLGIGLTNAHWTLIQGNYIGTDGTAGLGNQFHGMEVQNGTAETSVISNVVAFTRTYTGIRVRDSATNNRISATRVFGNATMEIDLGTSGPNANDSGDLDGGANHGQNSPELILAVTADGCGVQGTLSSRPLRGFQLEFFASAACDASGLGGGEIFLGSFQAMTAANGLAPIKTRFGQSIPAGYVFSATATDSWGNTSEFSSCAIVSPAPLITLSKASLDDGLEIGWTNWPPGFVLEETEQSIHPFVWKPSTNDAVLQNGWWKVRVRTEAPEKYFRLAW